MKLPFSGAGHIACRSNRPHGGTSLIARAISAPLARRSAHVRELRGFSRGMSRIGLVIQPDERWRAVPGADAASRSQGHSGPSRKFFIAACESVIYMRVLPRLPSEREPVDHETAVVEHAGVVL